MLLGSSTPVDAADFETLINGYRSEDFPVVELPWLVKEAYLESALPKNSSIFTKKTDFRIEKLSVYKRFKPEVELYFYENQLCEVIYFFKRPPDICLKNFSECDDFGQLLHLITKKFGSGTEGDGRVIIWPAGYEVKRKKLWRVGNIKIGLYEMNSPGTSILMAKHTHLNKAVFAAQQKYRQKKANASKE